MAGGAPYARPGGRRDPQRFLGSRPHRRPGREAEIYAAAKGGILAFSKSLARTFAPEVRVNVLAPGWIAMAFAAGLPEEERLRIAEATPLGRWGTPEDVAQAALFLASGEAGFLTGATVLVNGGTVM